MASITKRPNGRYRARYRDSSGRERTRDFVRKTDGQIWIDTVTAAVHAGTYVGPEDGPRDGRGWYVGPGPRSCSVRSPASGSARSEPAVTDFGPSCAA